MSKLTDTEARAVEAARKWARSDACNEPTQQRMDDVLASDMQFGFACGHLSREPEIAALRGALSLALGHIPHPSPLHTTITALLTSPPAST